MSKIEIPETKRQVPVSFLGIPLQRLVIALIVVIVLGIYAGVLLFGPNSLMVLMSLEEQRSSYELYIKRLKAQNAALQKEYFELKQLEPEF